MGEGPCIIIGAPQHLPLIMAVSYYVCNPIRALLPHWPKGLGGQGKNPTMTAFLLISTKEEVTGNRRYGLSTIWVNPHQARVPSMEEAVKELTDWVSSGPNWPYTLVQLNKDTWHTPLPKEAPRHLT